MVLISSEIWLTDTPRIAGAISFMTRRTPGSDRLRSKRGSMPIFSSGRICSASCSSPPRNTAHASASTGGSKYGTANSAMPMKARLSSTGVNAGIANRLQVLSTPPASATSDMKKMYGKVMRVSSTVSSNLPGSPEKPGADT